MFYTVHNMSYYVVHPNFYMLCVGRVVLPLMFYWEQDFPLFPSFSLWLFSLANIKGLIAQPWGFSVG